MQHKLLSMECLRHRTELYRLRRGDTVDTPEEQYLTEVEEEPRIHVRHRRAAMIAEQRRLERK